MLDQESNDTRTMIAMRMADPDTSAIIEKRNIQDVFAEEEEDALFSAAVAAAVEEENAIAAEARRGNRITVGRYFREPVRGGNLVMPRGYVLLPGGTYMAVLAEEENRVELVKVASIPFFISEKSENGKIMLNRKINGVWLRERLPAKAVMYRNTYFDLMIFPAVRGEFNYLQNYALASMSAAPFVTVPDTALIAALSRITEYLPEFFAVENFMASNVKYPFLVKASAIRDICEEYEIPYNTVRKWLAQRDIIQHDASIQRDAASGKPTRFLVFLKPLAEHIADPKK